MMGGMGDPLEAGQCYLGLQGPSMGVYEGSQPLNTYSPDLKTISSITFSEGVCNVSTVLYGDMQSYLYNPPEAGHC
jgi:hypothetical protein